MGLSVSVEVERKWLPDHVEIIAEGRLIARHVRRYGRGEQILNPLHYLAILGRKTRLPGSHGSISPMAITGSLFRFCPCALWKTPRRKRLAVWRLCWPTAARSACDRGLIGRRLRQRASGATYKAIEATRRFTPFCHKEGISKGISEAKKRRRPHRAAVSQVITGQRLFSKSGRLPLHLSERNLGFVVGTWANFRKYFIFKEMRYYSSWNEVCIPSANNLAASDTELSIPPKLPF